MSTLFTQQMTTHSSLATERSPRLLLIAYNFPPVGGAGVQRPVKWVKNLHRLGWDVTVLTTENPSVPARDESLLADIPDDVLVLRARTWEPDYRTKQGLVDPLQPGSRSLVSRAKSAVKGLFKHVVKITLQPDPQVLWVPNAIRTGKRILSELVHDAILVTAPAYSSFFIGTWLKHRFGLPLVFDYRDEWDMSGKYLENAQRDRFSQFVQDRMQKSLLKRADAVVATTQASTANLAEKLVRLKRTSTRVVTIYNGFDEDDFVPEVKHDLIHKIGEATACQEHLAINRPLQRPDSDQAGIDVAVAKDCGAAQKSFRLLYTGTLWNLTTIEPLVAAILRLNETAPELVSKLELVCVGRKTAEQTSILERVRLTGCRLDLIDYCDHAKVLEWLRSTDAVCLLLSDVAGAERVVPAKLFEYLANRKEMLAIVPRGETADIVQRFFPNGHLEPKDIDGIADWLKSRLADEERTSRISQCADINEFSRFTQTQRLTELLNSLIHERKTNGKSVR